MRYLMLISLLLYSLGSSAQFSDEEQRQIDSLNAIINNPESHDTSLAGAYVDLSNVLASSNLDTVIYLCSKAQQIAEKSLDSQSHSLLEAKFMRRTLADAFNNIGVINNIQGDIPLALEYFKKALRLFEELNNKDRIATSLNNIGFIYKNQGDIKLALEYYHQALKITEDIGDHQAAAGYLINIGFIYKYQDEINLALDYYQQALGIYEELGNKKGMATCYNNIGLINKNQGNIPIALDFYHKALKLYEELGNKHGMATSLSNIGVIHDVQNEIPVALEYYHKALKLEEELGNKESITTSLANIGRLLLKGWKEVGLNEREAVAQAKQYGTRGLRLAQEIGFPDEIETNASLLSKVANIQGNYKEALEMYELHIQMRDSIKNEETQKAAIRQQTKYEFEKAQLVKEQEEKEELRVESERIDRRNSLQYSVILVAILAVFGLVLALGKIQVSPKVAEGLIFFAFLILFEFLLVLSDPYVDSMTNGEPMYKLLANAVLAGAIFPAHAFFERVLKKRLLDNKRKA